MKLLVLFGFIKPKRTEPIKLTPKVMSTVHPEPLSFNDTWNHIYTARNSRK